MSDDIQVIDAQENVQTVRATGLADGRKLSLHGLADAAGAQIAPVSSGQVGNVTDSAWDGAAAAASLISVVKRTAVLLGGILLTVPGASAAVGGVASTARLLTAAASTNATSVKAAAGRIYQISGMQNASTPRYLKLYSKATAPTVGTDTPVKTILLPPLQAFVIDFPVGYYLATGIAFAITTGRLDADTGACAANDIECLNIDYA